MAKEKGPRPRVGEELLLTIDRLAYHSGHGVARHLGFVVFVPFTAPGDKVLAKVDELHASYGEARLVKLVEASPHRRQPPCPVAGRCGGCPWQQVTYPEQLNQKQQLLSAALRKALEESGSSLLPLVAAPEEFRYRNRIQLHRHGKDLGYYAYGSRELVEIEDCWIAEDALVKKFSQVRARSKQPGLPNEERVEIARLKTGEIELRAENTDASLSQFSQVNEAQNQRLIELLLNAVKGRSFEHVFDLYCGSGNLTFPLADAFPDALVTGVELSREMIRAASAASALLKRKSPISWKAENVALFLKSQRTRPKTLVVLDPPRPGCDGAVRESVLRLAPQQILYVSCNPTTLARDLEFWMKNGGYKLESAQGIDMFPQTAHLEAIVSLIAPSA